jgi:hypothetical protein
MLIVLGWLVINHNLLMENSWMISEEPCSLNRDYCHVLCLYSVPHPRPEGISPWGRVISAELDTCWQSGVVLKYGLTL